MYKAKWNSGFSPAWAGFEPTIQINTWKKSDWLFEMLQSDWLSLYFNYTRLANQARPCLASEIGRAQGGMAVSEYKAQMPAI